MIEAGDRVRFYDHAQAQLAAIIGRIYSGETGTVVSVEGDTAIIHDDLLDTSFPWPIDELKLVVDLD